MRFSLTETIAAPVAEVFSLFTDLENAAGRIQAIRHLKLHTCGPIGVGTRYLETRKMFGAEQTEEMEIIAFDHPHGYTVQYVTCGTDYRTRFCFIPVEAGTRVEQTLTARPLTLAAKLMSPLDWLMLAPMKRCFKQDLRDLKQIAEREARPR